MTDGKSVVGDLINFRGLVYAPINENGVIFLFGKILDDLHMYIEEIKPGFPDCIARRFTGRGWERVSIEFEYDSLSFKNHKHDPKDCDIIVCWKHDWKDCPIEVIELKTEIQTLENWKIKPPNTQDEKASNGIKNLEEIFDKTDASKKVKQWYFLIEKLMKSYDREIWFNIAKVYIGVYSPERAFASIKIQSKSIQIECFSRGKPLDGTRVSNAKLSPRWNKFTIKSDKDFGHSLAILRESLKRIKEALHDGENVSYFSQPVNASMEVVS